MEKFIYLTLEYKVIYSSFNISLRLKFKILDLQPFQRYSKVFFFFFMSVYNYDRLLYFLMFHSLLAFVYFANNPLVVELSIFS